MARSRQNDPLRVAIEAFRGSTDEELTPVHIVNNFEMPRKEQPTVPDSDPPSLSIRGPAGLRLHHAPAWLILVLGLVAIVAASLVYVATHT